MSAEPEPRWLRNLRTSVNAARMSQLRTVPVNVDDLEKAIGACQKGPGGTAMVGHDERGDVVVDFQGLVKAVHFTPDEAIAFADVMKERAGRARLVLEDL